MRHTITIIGDISIKNQTIHCKKVPHFQQECIVKIQQQNKHIYAIYTPDITSQKSQLSLMYMKINAMEESLATMIKIVTPSKLKSLEIQLSQIDYALVNNNFGLLERSFLDQVNLVWPQAKIPLFYNEGNYITLMPKVKEIHLVDPYAAISFMIKDQVINKQKNENLQEDLDEESQFEDRMLVLGKLKKQVSIFFGYDNAIEVEKQIFDNLVKYKVQKNVDNNQRQFYCTVQPQLPFLSHPSFEEYQQYVRLQAANKLPQLKPILVKIVSSQKQGEEIQMDEQNLKVNQQEQISQQQVISYSCSEICKISLGLSQKLILTQQNLNYSPGFQTISFEMFLKQLSMNKYKISLKFSSQKTPKQIEKLRNDFSYQFVKYIRKRGEFIFFQNYFPFFLSDEVCELMVRKISANKRSYDELKSFLLIKDISVNKDQNQQDENRSISIMQNNLMISEDLSFEKCKQWLPIMKKLQQQKYNSQSEKVQGEHQNDQPQDKFRVIFETCYKKQITQCCQYLQEEILNQGSSSKILVTTYSSNGKTYLKTYLSSLQERNYPSWYVDCKVLMNPINRIDQIKDYIAAFITLSPYKLVFFDNVDSMIPLIEEGDQMRQKQKITSHILGHHLFQLIEENNKIAILTAKSEANIDPIFKFNKIIKLKNPNRQLRAQIAHSILKNDKNPQWIEQFIDKTQSFSLGSLAHYLISKQIPIKKQSKRKNDFSKIVGLKQAKRVIQSVIEKPNKFGFIYEKVKIKVPRGILLYGATGNGKTALGSAVEDQFPMKYFSVKGSDILSKYIGGSEAAVRQIFQKALSVAPSIIFFDEFESIVPRRNSSGTGVTDRVVNQFLCYLDGVSSTTGVFIIAASSRPDLIDPALLRPGRIDSHIYLQYPNQTDRSQLLNLFSNSIKLQISEQQFVKSTENYSYSDLIGLLKQLRIKKSSLVLKQKQNPSVEEFKYIEKKLFQQTIKSYRIGTDLQEQKQQKQLYERFKQGKGPQIKKQKFVQM